MSSEPQVQDSAISYLREISNRAPAMQGPVIRDCQPQLQSRFLDLDADIRLIIYDECSGERNVHDEPTYSRNDQDHPDQARKALLLTCRQIYLELIHRFQRTTTMCADRYKGDIFEAHVRPRLCFFTLLNTQPYMLSKVQRFSYDATINMDDKQMLIPERLKRGTVDGFHIHSSEYVDFNGAETFLSLIPAALFDTLEEIDIRATYCNWRTAAEGQQNLFVSDVMNFRYALIWQAAAVHNVDIDHIRNSHTDPITPVITRGRWDRVIELLMDNRGKDLEAKGWDLTKHIKLEMPSDVTDDNEDEWLAKEVTVKGLAIAVRKPKNAIIPSRQTVPAKASGNIAQRLSITVDVV